MLDAGYLTLYIRHSTFDNSCSTFNARHLSLDHDLEYDPRCIIYLLAFSLGALHYLPACLSDCLACLPACPRSMLGLEFKSRSESESEPEHGNPSWCALVLDISFHLSFFLFSPSPRCSLPPLTLAEPPTCATHPATTLKTHHDTLWQMISVRRSSSGLGPISAIRTVPMSLASCRLYLFPFLAPVETPVPAVVPGSSRCGA